MKCKDKSYAAVSFGAMAGGCRRYDDLTKVSQGTGSRNG